MTIAGAKGSDEGLPDASLDEFIDSLVKSGCWDHSGPDGASRIIMKCYGTWNRRQTYVGMNLSVGQRRNDGIVPGR